MADYTSIETIPGIGLGCGGASCSAPRDCKLMPASLRRALRPLLFVLGLAAATVPAHGQSSSTRTSRCANSGRVLKVDFAGSPMFSDVEMATFIVNEQPSFISRLFRFPKYMCVDTLEVQRDALRLAVLHRQQGWFLANVAPQYDRKKDGVNLLFDITPGPEARVDSIAVLGLPTPETDPRAYDGPLLAMRGQRFDRIKVQALIDSVVERLQNAGYARAKQPITTVSIDTASATDTVPAKVRLELTFAAGARLRVGEVHVRIQGIGERRTVDSADIMSLIRLRPAQRYRVRNVVQAQRDLYRTDAFKLVLIDTIAPRVGSADSLIDFQVTVAEARTRYAKAGAGWATQDCGRVQARAQDRAFLAPGRRAEVSVRASKLGVGAPFDFAKPLCSPTLRDDPFSEKVNYYLGTTISNTRFWGYPFAPTFSIYSERRGEPLAYLRETSIGTLFELSSTLWRRTVVTPGIQYERGRTISDPLISCTRFNLCQPQDETVSLFGRGVGVLSTALTHDRTDNAANPTYGSRYRGEVRAGLTSASTKQKISFYRGNAEASAYQPLLRGTIAARVQLARVFSPNAPLVNGSPLLPQQERLFAGGQNSVRGFQQNTLGPVVYAFNDSSKITTEIINGIETRTLKADAKPNIVVPRGGTALVVGNLEWRRRVGWPTNKLQIALFADAGTVFETNVQAFNWRDVRVTPGFGARLDTPLGPFRLDIGYNPYEAPAARALFFTGNTKTQRGAIQCVTPGNTIPVGSTTLDLSRCPATYRPTQGSALSRFVFHFSLGQAF
ncbi:MAG: BamA/TamA family outer membrane protein [Gemmatimonadaceae bacterium]